jgi:hypothetical protein
VIPNERFNTSIQPWQAQLLGAFDRGEADMFVLEWARRHWKTTTILNLMVKEACKYPNTVYDYVAPLFTQARKIVWDDPNMLDSILPPKSEIGWIKSETKFHVKFANGSLIRILGADNPDSMRGGGCQGVCLDEFAQMKKEVWEEIYMPIMAAKHHGKDKGKRRRRWVIFGYTPKGVNHATQEFDRAACIAEYGDPLPTFGKALHCQPGWFASRVINDRSNFLDPEFLKMTLDRWPQALRDQEINCARITEEEMTLITSAMIDSLNRKIDYPRITKRIIACDPSMGGDECSMAANHNTHVLEHKQIRTRDTMRIVGELVLLGSKHQIPNYIVDCIGIGKGIYDRLCELRDDKTNLNVVQVIGFNSSNKSTDPLYFNARAQMWWYVMEQIRDSLVEYPQDEETRRQIPFASRYKVASNGCIQIQIKDKIKEDLGCSPDRAERWAMGIWGLSQVEDSVNMRQVMDYSKIDRGNPLDGYASDGYNTGQSEQGVF